MSRVLIFALVVCLGLINQVKAQEEIEVYGLNNNPPFSWTEGNINRGIDVDIIREAGKRAGFSVEFNLTPWKRMIGAVKGGQADAVMPLFYREEREEFGIFTSVPIRMARFSVFVPISKEAPARYTGLKDFQGQVVAKVRGLGVSSDFAQSIIENNITLRETSTADQAFQMLIRRRMDGFVHDTMTGQYVSHRLKLDKQVRMLEPPINEGEGVFLVFSRQKYKERADEMTKRFNDVLTQMYSDGTIYGIVRFYLKQS